MLEASRQGKRPPLAAEAVPYARRGNAVATFIQRRPLGALGALIVVVLVLAAIFAPAIAPYDPLETNFIALLRPPGPEYLLGTDAFGRDLLSRLIFGARTALLVGFTSSIVGATLGMVLGTISAYFGGRVDLTLQRVLEIFLSFPIVVLAMA